MAQRYDLFRCGICSTMRNRTDFQANAVLPLCGAAAAVCLLLTFPDAAKQGMSQALSLCGTVMIPSLFPMLTVSRFAASCRCPALLQKVCAKPLRALFGLSPGCLTPLALGLTGGYPLAAKVSGAARAEGRITEQDARRLTLFFTCPGIPFAVIVAGGCFHSRAVGWTLLTACVTADVLAAACCRLLTRHQAAPPTLRLPSEQPVSPLSMRLVLSVDGAAKAMLSICAWICVFTTLTSLFNAVTGGRGHTFFALTAEVTAALETAAGFGNIPLTAACLSFGGICVFCQLLPDIAACSAGAARYLAIRLACAGLSYLTETALLRLLPLPVPTEMQLGRYYLTANSAAGSTALLFLCAVFMEETARPRKREFR